MPQNNRISTLTRIVKTTEARKENTRQPGEHPYTWTRPPLDVRGGPSALTDPPWCEARSCDLLAPRSVG